MSRAVTNRQPGCFKRSFSEDSEDIRSLQVAGRGRSEYFPTLNALLTTMLVPLLRAEPDSGANARERTENSVSSSAGDSYEGNRPPMARSASDELVYCCGCLTEGGGDFLHARDNLLPGVA